MSRYIERTDARFRASAGILSHQREECATQGQRHSQSALLEECELPADKFEVGEPGSGKDHTYDSPMPGHFSLTIHMNTCDAFWNKVHELEGKNA